MSLGLHCFTVLVTGATFVLIVAGALVTSHDAGLAAPDWPLSFGQVFPPMVGNLFWEHGHRLIASSVGLLTIALNLYLYKSEPRRWVRRLGLVALFLVIAQGLLGGLTVKLLLPLWVSSAHATLAQIFFCTMVSLSVFTSPGWIRQRTLVEENGKIPLRHLSATAGVAILAQLVLGATLRHSATWDQHLPTSLVLAHVTGALVVTTILVGVVVVLFRRHPDLTYLRRPANLAMFLLGLQLCLGVAAYITRVWSPDDPQPLNPMVAITVAHVACGALVFAVTIVLTLRTFQVLRAADSASDFALKAQGALG